MNPRISLVLALSVVLLAGALLGGQPRHSSQPLDITHNGVHGVYNLHNKRGELLLYNFRAVEDGRFYRGSGFPANRNAVLAGKGGFHPAAYFDRQLFDFFRSKNIRHIVSLQESDQIYAERGYFDYWGQKTAYKIKVEALAVRSGHAYDLDARPLLDHAPEHRRFGLKAATEFIRMMQARKAQDGALYLHCDAGKDRTGVVVAAYEMWRNWNRVPPEKLWQQVMARYLVSNTLIARDQEAARWAGATLSGQGDAKNKADTAEGPFVRREWLQPLRSSLERIARL
jgi:hypothetical protein